MKICIPGDKGVTFWDIEFCAGPRLWSGYSHVAEANFHRRRVARVG